MSKKSQKICFIVFVSLFATFWVASMVMLSIAVFNETATASIEAWYAERHPVDEAAGETAKELDLMNLSNWMLIISTAGLLITLLFKELKKKYNTK